MNYSRSMVELVYEIRRNVPTEMKSDIKLSNPNLLENLINHYYDDVDTSTKPLIQQLMQKAGGNWSKELAEHLNPQAAGPRYHANPSLQPASANDVKTNKTKRVYRGRIIS